MNKVALVGRITADPKINIIDGRKMARFTIALRRKLLKNDKKGIDYVSCVAWEHNADFVEQHFSRSNNISVAGEIRTSKYERDGRINYSTCILVEDVSFIRSDEDFAADERSVPNES